MFKNPEARRATIAAVAITLVLAIVAQVLAGGIAALLVLACGAATSAAFLSLTARRYARITEMAERVDQALHNERSVSLSDMQEGELSILASEVDKALTRLTLTAEELAAEKASLADSLADISHQLRTPLTSLGLTLELLRKQAQAEGCPGLLERLHQSEQLLSQVQWLVEALLKLARIDAGAVALVHEPVDVAALVASAAKPLAIPYDLADVTLVQEVQPGCSFMGDEAWTREALENVLKNCLEHTPAGGQVRVEAMEDTLACRISVTDSGPGIAAEDLPHVFERFYRGKDEPTGVVKPAGIGIGLSLAQSLVAAQDGRITASNVVDEAGRVAGAHFDIAFFKTTV